MTVFPSLPLQGYLLRGDDVIVMTEMKLRSAEETECEEHTFATEIHLAKKKKKKKCRRSLPVFFLKKIARCIWFTQALTGWAAGLKGL